MIMTELQKEFAKALIELGLSKDTLIVVCMMIQSKKDIREMLHRIISLEDSGQEITDGAVLQIMVNMMKEASEPITEEDNDDSEQEEEQV